MMGVDKDISDCEHDCGYAKPESTAPSKESILVMGNYMDYDNPTETIVADAMMRRENKASPKAKAQGVRTASLNAFGEKKINHRLRRHIEYINLKGED